MANPVRHDPIGGDERRPDRIMTLDEYFLFEETSTTRHEFVAGEVFAMSGGTHRHDRITGNIFGHVWAAARSGPCRPYQSNMMLRVGDRVYYPDVMVACGPAPGFDRVEDAPCLLVEVLSRSTWRTDRREKLAAYTSLPSLGTYLVVDQERRFVDRYARDAGGVWQRDSLVDEGAIVLSCPAPTLTLDEIYEGVALPPPDEVWRVREELAAEYR